MKAPPDMTKSSDLPPLIAFFDERFKSFDRVTRMIVGCCLFGRDRWIALHHHAARVSAVRLKRRLQAIDKLLARISGVAVLVYADLTPELLPPQETDGTSDIPRMSRTDNAWSQLTLSTVAAALAWLQRSDVSLGTVDLYYDRKDLTSEHRIQFENVLRAILPEIAREAAAEYPHLFTTVPHELRFRTICGIDKPESAVAPDAFQHGTGLAHHLYAQATALITRGSVGHTLIRNHTTAVHNMISKFVPSVDETPEDQEAT